MEIISLLATALKGSGGNLNIPQVSFSLESLLNLAYSLAGIVAVVVIIIGGILYATSDGDAGKLQKAKNSILYSIVGLIFIMLASAITNFVLGRF